MNKKMLVVLPSTVMGGAEKIANTICNQSIRNFELTVVFMKGKESSKWNNLDAEKIYIDAKKELFSLPYLIFFLFNKKYDIVFSTHTHVNSLLSFLRGNRILKTKKLICRESTVIFDRFNGTKKVIFKLLYCLYGNQDLIVYQTNYMKNQLQNNIKKVNKINSIVLTNPISSVKNSIVKKKIDTFSIVSVGRLNKNKNFNLVINALYELKKEYNVNFLYTIVGDGEDFYELEKEIEQKKMKDCIKLYGYSNNVSQIIFDQDLGIISSIREGYPNVLLEMMAANVKNIITTNCFGEAKIIPGITVVNNDISDLVKNIITVYSNKSNKSDVYKRFIKDLTPSKYWNKILKSI